MCQKNDYLLVKKIKPQNNVIPNTIQFFNLGSGWVVAFIRQCQITKKLSRELLILTAPTY